jgi:hypothetical protein
MAKFVKGQSGNPKGRPRKTPEQKKSDKEKRDRISAEINKRMQESKFVSDFVDKLFEQHEKGNTAATAEILNRYEGKVKDVLQVDDISQHIPNQEEQADIKAMFQLSKRKKENEPTVQ